MRPEDSDDAPIPGMAGLREAEPPPSLVAGVMRRIAEPPAPSFWRWLRRPFTIQLRVSPIGLGADALALAGALALLLLPGRATTAGPTVATSIEVVPSRATPASEARVLVRFTLAAKGAKHVALAGSFNGWNADGTRLEPVNDSGLFAGTVPLPPGVHEYMFVVDGQWVTDPAAEERRPDGFGRQNALIRL